MYKISIIIPIYNVEKYLNKCLDSVLNQTIGIKNLQVIMVDDASTDKSVEIMEEYASKYTNFISVRLPNRNYVAGKARNEGMKYAQGKYLMFSDADDFFTEDACEIMYNAIEKYNADFITANYINIHHDETPYTMPVFDTEKYKEFKLNIKDYKNTFAVMCSSVCNKIFNRSFIEKNNIRFLEGVPAEDAYFSMSSFLVSQNAYYINNVIYNYRQRNTDNLSVSYYCSLDYFKRLNEGYRKNYEIFKEHNQIGFYRYFYAKHISYMLCKFIDSNQLTDEERIQYFKDTKWYYDLSEKLHVLATQENLSELIKLIRQEEHEKALEETRKIKEQRDTLPHHIKEELSRPKKEFYDEISKYDYLYE